MNSQLTEELIELSVSFEKFFLLTSRTFYRLKVETSKEMAKMQPKMTELRRR